MVKVIFKVLPWYFRKNTSQQLERPEKHHKVSSINFETKNC